MKVALVYHSFARYRRPVLCELFRRMGEDMWLVSSDGRDAGSIASLSPDTCEEWRAQWRIVENRWLGRQVFLWQSGVLRATRDVQVIIALGGIQFLSTWVLLLLAKLRRQKTYLWTHGLYGNESKLKLLARCWFYKLADGVLVYGQYAKRLLVEQGLPECHVHVIYNSLDTREQDAIFRARDAAELSRAKAALFGTPNPVLAFIGRLTPEKKLDQFLRAAKNLQDRGRPVNCLFVGDGTEKARLLALVQELGLSAFFAGERYDEEGIGRYLMMSDLVVSPGNIGLTAMHALAYGVPVVTHSTFSEQGPEFEAVQEGVTGAFFRQDDVDDLAEKIDGWLQAHPCRTAASEMSCRAVIYDHYTPEFQVTEILRAITYGSAMNSKE